MFKNTFLQSKKNLFGSGRLFLALILAQLHSQVLSITGAFTIVQLFFVIKFVYYLDLLCICLFQLVMSNFFILVLCWISLCPLYHLLETHQHLQQNHGMTDSDHFQSKRQEDSLGLWGKRYTDDSTFNILEAGIKQEIQRLRNKIKTEGRGRRLIIARIRYLMKQIELKMMMGEKVKRSPTGE